MGYSFTFLPDQHKCQEISIVPIGSSNADHWSTLAKAFSLVKSTVGLRSGDQKLSGIATTLAESADSTCVETSFKLFATRIDHFAMRFATTIKGDVFDTQNY